MAMANDPSLRSAAVPAEEFEEISLVDIVRVLHRRWVVLAVALGLALAGGLALVFVTEPEYEASVTVIPLSHTAIIHNWLSSRQAAEFAANEQGERLFPVLFPEEWDATAGDWRGPPPTTEEVGLALKERASVTGGTSRDALVRITIALPDPTLARDVAASYVVSLGELRPQLENLTRSELFDKYYDGTNAQEAQRRAETAAREQTYWIVFDTPSVPTEPVKPRPVLYMALATVLGLMGGVMLVFLLEWLSKYRGEFARIEPPR